MKVAQKHPTCWCMALVCFISMDLYKWKVSVPHLLIVESLDAVNSLASSLQLARAFTPAQCCMIQCISQLSDFQVLMLRAMSKQQAVPRQLHFCETLLTLWRLFVVCWCLLLVLRAA